MTGWRMWLCSIIPPMFLLLACLLLALCWLSLCVSVSHVHVLVGRFCQCVGCCHPLAPAAQRCADGGGASSREEGPTDSEEVVGIPESDAEDDSEGVGDLDSDGSDSDIAAEQFGSDLESSDEDTGVAKTDNHLNVDVVGKAPAEVAPSLATPHIPYTFKGEGGLAAPFQGGGSGVGCMLCEGAVRSHFCPLQCQSRLQTCRSSSATGSYVCCMCAVHLIICSTPCPTPYLLRTPSECEVIVSRIHKCHHQSLSQKNRTKLEVAVRL